MSKSERKQHDGAWGFDFGDPEQVLVVPPDYLGEEAAKKGGLFSMFSKPKTEPQNYSAAALVEHPMSANMRSSLEEAFENDADVASQADDDGFTFLHQLSLAGSLDGVDVALNHGADVNAKTGNGLTPMQLAKTLGWKKVMARLQEAGGQ